ncbi:MAG TPA: hypothetical protein VMP01_21885 [Pirellulaceae bacterium]|nr:hypothetical protein [Pirellulaceae bacterium]
MQAHWRGKFLEIVVLLYYVLPMTVLLLAGYLIGGIWLWILGVIAILWPLGNIVASMLIGSD